METTPPVDRFDEAYRSRSAPWVIGEPQPAIVELRPLTNAIPHPTTSIIVAVSGFHP